MARILQPTRSAFTQPRSGDLPALAGIREIIASRKMSSLDALACTVASRACISCSETALMPVFISFQLKLRAPPGRRRQSQ